MLSEIGINLFHFQPVHTHSKSQVGRLKANFEGL